MRCCPRSSARPAARCWSTPVSTCAGSRSSARPRMPSAASWARRSTRSRSATASCERKNRTRRSPSTTRRASSRIEMNARSVLVSAAIAIASTAFALGAGELILRAKNASMKNYDIEMWRYAKELKRRSDIPVLGHEHVASSSARLQSVDIRIDEHGLRGGPVGPRKPAERRILVLGSSVTLGWVVPEEQTMTARLQRMVAADRKQVQVLNAGIGNYNAVRYVER